MHSIIILIAKDFIVIPPLLFAAVWLKLSRNDKKQAVLVGILGVVFTVVLALIGSKLFNDPRPFVAGHFTPYFAHGSDNGFPSDHTLLTGLVASLTLLYSRKVGLFALVIAALIGASRVIAGVHHMTDIIGALLFAGIGIELAAYVVRRHCTPTSRRVKA